MSNLTIVPTDTEDAIVAKLVQLIRLCQERGIDLDLLMDEARRIHDGEPYFGT